MAESGDEQCLTRAEVRRSLNALIPRSPPDTPIDDAIFLELATTLKSHADTSEWGLRPRLYCLLRMIGLEQDSPVFQSFIIDNLYDVAFPFREIYLPMKLKDEAELMEAFLSSQWIVCTRTELMNASNFTSHLLIHRHIRDGQAHFDEYGNLGKGGSASVERVRHKLSGRFFARKKISRGNNIGTQRRKLDEFENELNALQKVRHKHLVSYVGSYTDLWSFSLILEPVAEVELKAMLERQARERLNAEEISWLRNAFGCLATALAYCHERRLRHKDIKPGNILLNGGHVYLCDFGISYDWSDINHATTTGDPGRFTLRYCAPEVVNRQARNEKSDVWSLACVYIEMISIIKGHTLQELDHFLDKEGSPSADYWCQPETVKAWLAHIRDDSSDDVALDWIEKMFQQNPSIRPTAADIVDDIQAHSHNTSIGKRFVGRCCESSSQRSGVSTLSRSDSSVDPPDMIPSQLDCTSSRRHETSESVQLPVNIEPIILAESNANPSRFDSRQVSGSSQRSPRPISSVSNMPSSSQFVPEPDSPGTDWHMSIPMRTSYSSEGRSSHYPNISTDLGNTTYNASSPVIPPGLGKLPCGSTSTPVKHEHTGSALGCFCGAKGQERQLFEAPASSLDIYEGAELSQHSDSCYGQIGAVRVYESMDNTVWKNTRRIVVSAPGNNSKRRCTSFWVPLTNVFSRVDSDNLSLWWSDCNHIRRRGTGAWGDLYDRVYDANTPNHHIMIHVPDGQGARLVECLRSPSGDTEKIRRSGQVMLSEDQNQFAYMWNIGRVHSHQLTLDYRILVLSSATDAATMYSSLYTIYPDLDFEMHLFNNEIQRHNQRAWRFHIKIKNLSSPMYISDLREEPEIKPTDKAICKEVREVDSVAVINFSIGDHHEFPVPPDGVVKLFRGLTSWTMTFFGSIRRLKTRRSLGLSKDYGSGDLMLWERSSQSGRVCQLTFRVHADAKHDPAKIWTAGSVRRGSTLSTSNDADAKIRIFNKASGPFLDIQKMAANDPRAAEDPNVPHRVAHDREEHSDITITLSDTHYRREFCNMIEVFKESAANSAPSDVRMSAARGHDEDVFEFARRLIDLYLLLVGGWAHRDGVEKEKFWRTRLSARKSLHSE